MSLPTRERGLKHVGEIRIMTVLQSLPTRERGLKQHITGALAAGLVAPYAGAWIETLILPEKPRVQGVAPYAGAWIETVISSSSV